MRHFDKEIPYLQRAPLTLIDIMRIKSIPPPHLNIQSETYSPTAESTLFCKSSLGQLETFLSDSCVDLSNEQHGHGGKNRESESERSREEEEEESWRAAGENVSQGTTGRDDAGLVGELKPQVLHCRVII